MGREIRNVPANWEHPKNNSGKYQPLMANYVRALEHYKDDVEEFIKHIAEVLSDKSETIIYKQKFTDPQKVFTYLTEDDQLTIPNIKDYMPSGSWCQLYEDVSEGMPLSPPFATKQKLVEWLSNNEDFWGSEWSKEAAQDIVETGFAMSGVISNGRYYKPEEQHLLKEKK